MWHLKKTFKFESSHILSNHHGKCGRLHGHSWKLTVYLSSHQLITEGSSTGMVEDYAEISAAVLPLIDDQLDHRHLNYSTTLANPTSEVLAAWIYEQLKPKLPKLVAIEIQETESASCTYAPGQIVSTPPDLA